MSCELLSHVLSGIAVVYSCAACSSARPVSARTPSSPSRAPAPIPAVALAVVPDCGPCATAVQPSASQELTSLQPAINILPERIKDYSTLAEGGSVQVSRTNGWSVKLRVKPQTNQQTFAGYCWHINEVDARRYETLRVVFASVERPAELRFELHDSDGHTDRVLDFPRIPDVRLRVDNYRDVQSRVSRFCLVLIAEKGKGDAVETEFVLTSVHFE